MQGGMLNLALALLAIQLALTHPAVRKVRALLGIAQCLSHCAADLLPALQDVAVPPNRWKGACHRSANVLRYESSKAIESQ